ncbi:UPF0764 protein C16orf89 homolog [Gadus morhua]|uniref:Chromosome 16 open reading frame 89 n=1 Tax=Gadus morhua TaxID=8049 RepID=A0A8C5FWD3_GADMO|nr:UPF0764 protein C16orf89 homolog [Gadus morhua]XP_056466591.1 UPF0764 protein C16orf89 homolog [Gadus chalcogrammus]
MPGEKPRAMPGLVAVLVVLVAASAAQEDVTDHILNSLSRAAAFLESEHENINLDGVVGYLILQAELKEAVRTWPHSDPLSWAQRTSTVALLRRLDQSLAKATLALQRHDPKYYREFEPLLDWRFWKVPQAWGSTDPSLRYASSQPSECYDEQLSDSCMTLLLGTWKQKGTPCIVTESCRDTMTMFDCPLYSLSHQLLYFLIASMKGCSSLLKGDVRESRANLTEADYQKIFCSNMMSSNQEALKTGLNAHTQDIFIENILLCGLAGFSDFYKPDWLQHILRLQDPTSGCFGRDERAMSQIMGEELLEQLRPPPPPPRRVKRREKTLRDGCSSHVTGVAVSALGGYLNYQLTEQDITKRPLAPPSS